VLGDTLAQLEGGAKGIVTSTGMSAILLVLQLLEKDDVLIFPQDCYGGSYRLFDTLSKKGLFKAIAFDFQAPNWKSQLKSLNPKIVWVETPSNPLLRITDVKQVADVAHSLNALLTVDNTFLSPVWQKPIELGADIVIHSTTKYINGHSDVVGGAVIAKTEELGEKLAWWCNCLGISGAPFDAFLTLRGIRTLATRLKAHEENAQKIAEFLYDSPYISQVYYPGLESHPGHFIAKAQQKGFGAIVSFKINAPESALKDFIESFEVFSLAESLGGVESLIAHPATMTHAAMDESARLRAGIDNTLIRLSIGIEHIDDLLADFERAFASLGTTKVERKQSALCA
jgi:cystathionine gamma-synthase